MDLQDGGLNVTGGEIWNNPNYCPNCGARMIESEELGGVVE